MKKDFSKTIQEISNIPDVSQLQQIQDIPQIQQIQYKKDGNPDKRFKKNPNLVPFSLRMDIHDKEKLEKLAYQNRRTVTELINEAIKEYLAKPENHIQDL